MDAVIRIHDLQAVDQVAAKEQRFEPLAMHAQWANVAWSCKLERRGGRVGVEIELLAVPKRWHSDSQLRAELPLPNQK